MADLIERDYLIEKFEDTGPPSVSEMGKGYDLGIKAALRVVKNAPAVNRWISVEDALPDALENVLVCTDINTVTIAWINGDGWTFADTGNGHTENWSFEDVKYWMHLPEPPKGEQK